ncbi:archease [Acidithiobacillus sp.]|uniref:archease n=1 Tax=Acidithiobacillus sp. TaxID=1872118 RepID=UPI0025BCAA1C|nr:archease [Acidithiobacillus sp.]MCK9188851.1 archease [Acidithiobacillus sp.]MCK9358364.1 archease [Acidithiobacillus sp.]
MTVFSYFDHDADIGVIGRGRTLEESFEGVAAGTFAIMADLAQVRAARSVRIDFEEEDLELALVTWLNTLLAEAGTHGLVLGRFRLVRDNSHWQGEAWGEPWREDLDRGVEVKGATLTMLRVSQGPEGFEARCVVDV